MESIARTMGTIGAAVGVDITNDNETPEHQWTKVLDTRHRSNDFYILGDHFVYGHG